MKDNAETTAQQEAGSTTETVNYFPNIDKMFESLEEQRNANIGDVHEKWGILCNQKNPNGFYVTSYQAGISKAVIERVCDAVRDINSTDLFEALEINKAGGEIYEFWLAKNGSEKHKELERKQHGPTGALTDDVYDFGDVRIYLFDDAGDRVSLADFSLYRVKI